MFNFVWIKVQPGISLQFIFLRNCFWRENIRYTIHDLFFIKTYHGWDSNLLRNIIVIFITESKEIGN